jgi:HK97 family phage portal protein
MSFMSRLPRPKAVNTEMERMIRDVMGGGYGSSSGVAVNSESAMRLMTVNNCVKVLFNCISQTPCQLMEEIGDEKNKAKSHPLFKVIGKRPNKWMTAGQLWGLAIVHVSLRGNFYAFKVKVGDQVRELLPINPDRVSEVKQNSDWSLTYKISTANNWDGKPIGPGRDYRDYSQDEIFHIRGMSYDGFTGLNPIAYARETIGLGLASERFLSNYFGKGMHPGAIIKSPQSLDPVTHANLWEAYKRKYSGLSAAQDLMLLDNGMTVEFPPIKLVDQQFLEQMRFTESQICGMYGVPLILVQAGSTPATYASSSQFKQSFVDYTIAPIVKNFETTVDVNLISLPEQDRYYAKFNLGALLRGNMTERFAAYKEAINTEFMNPNEARSLEDWNPYEGGEIYRTRTSTIKESDKVKQPENEPNQSPGDGGIK